MFYSPFWFGRGFGYGGYGGFGRFGYPYFRRFNYFNPWLYRRFW